MVEQLEDSCPANSEVRCVFTANPAMISEILPAGGLLIPRNF